MQGQLHDTVYLILWNNSEKIEKRKQQKKKPIFSYFIVYSSIIHIHNIITTTTNQPLDSRIVYFQIWWKLSIRPIYI